MENFPTTVRDKTVSYFTKFYFRNEILLYVNAIKLAASSVQCAFTWTVILRRKFVNICFVHKCIM